MTGNAELSDLYERPSFFPFDAIGTATILG